MCPRQHTLVADRDGKGVYLDISGMYASIMKNDNLPYGKTMWKPAEQIDTLMIMVRRLQQEQRVAPKSWRQINEAIEAKFGLFIADADFQDHPHNLEPVVQFRDVNHGNATRFTVARRQDNITNVDVALLVASGGTVFRIDRCLTWEFKGNIMEPWIVKCNEMKKQGELTGNGALKSFGKLLANSAYG